MFYFLCLLPLASVVGLALLAQRQRLGLSGLAFHPYNLLGFFIFVTILDFLMAYSIVDAGHTIRFARYSVDSTAAVREGLTFFSLCTTAITCGVFAGSRPIASRFDNHNSLADSRAAFFVGIVAAILAGVTVISVVGTALSKGSIMYVAASKGIFFRDNAILTVLYSTLLPAFFLFGSRARNPVLVGIALVICLVLLLPIGSRGNLAMLIIATLFWISQTVRFPLFIIYLASPLVAASLTYYRWAVRDINVYGSFQQFLASHGGLGGALFNTPEISMAEAIIVNVSQPTVERAPWDSVLGTLLIPVPRAIVGFKPFGASTEFTQVADPARWLLVKSDWTVTGFVNLLMEFGYIGGILALGALSFAWSRILSRSAAREMDIAFTAPLLIFLMYMFYRADLYNVGVAIWPALMVVLGHRFLRNLISQCYDRPPARRRR